MIENVIELLQYSLFSKNLKIFTFNKTWIILDISVKLNPEKRLTDIFDPL